MNQRRWLFLILGVFLALLFFERPGSVHFEPDEARYAEIPREMLASGDFVTPRLNGSRYFEKPPLLYWVNALSIKVLGDTPFAARLGVRLATVVITLCLIIGLGGVAGLWAGLVFISTPLAFALGRINLTDAIIAACLTFTFFSLRAFLRERDQGRSGRIQAASMGAGMGLAMLAKGLIGIVFPAGVLFFWCAALGKWRRLTDLFFSLATPAFFLIATPWFVLAGMRNPGMLEFFFIREHFARFTTTIHERQAPFYYFAALFTAGFLPWLFVFGRAVRPLLTFDRRRWAEKSDDLFFAIWLVLIIGFFSLSHSKLAPYIFPALPAAAALAGKKIAGDSNFTTSFWTGQAVLWTVLMAGAFAVGLQSEFLAQYGIVNHAVGLAGGVLIGVWGAVYFSRRSGEAAFLCQSAGWAVALSALIFAIPSVMKDYSDRDMAIVARDSGTSNISLYGYFSHNFPLTLKRPVPVMEFKGELDSLNDRNPDLFWNSEKFWSEWDSGVKMTVGVHRPKLVAFTNKSKLPCFVRAQNRRCVVVSNFEP